MSSNNGSRVTKSNAMNSAVVKRNSMLGLREQKVALAVVSQISPDDPDLKPYRLTIPELSRLTGIETKKLYGQLIDDICISLTSTVFTIKEPGANIHVPFFIKAKHRLDGYVDFVFAPELKPHLIGLKSSFTTYQLNQISSLSSAYAIRMYELLRQKLSLSDVKSGKRSVIRSMQLSDLRDCLGIKPRQYAVFRDFRRYVLEVAQAELSKKTDLKFSFGSIRQGRKIGIIQFCIQENDRQAFEAVPDDETTHAQIVQHCLDDAMLDKYLIQRPAATFFMTVAGNSITESGIADGSILVVDRSLTPQDVETENLHGKSVG